MVEFSWDRDKKIQQLCKLNKIYWYQFQRDGIIRGIKTRKNWRKNWNLKMAQPIIKNNFSICINEKLQHPFLIPSKLENILKTYPKKFQPAGEDNAWKYLESFANNRGEKKLSKICFKTIPKSNIL